MTSVIVADDQDLVRVGLCTILERREGIEVLGQAANGREAVREARRLRPDVVLMDVRPSSTASPPPARLSRGLTP